MTRTAAAGGEAHTVFRVGEMDGRLTPRVEEVAKLLAIVDSTKITTNLNGERWSKLVANSMGNGLQAITGLSSREMAMTAEVRRLTIRLAAEAVEVGQAMGLSLVPIGGKDPEVWLAAGRGEGLEELELSIMQAAEAIRGVGAVFDGAGHGEGPTPGDRVPEWPCCGEGSGGGGWTCR